MAGRTLAVGDLHGDLDMLLQLLGRVPKLDDGDTLVFLGDYVDRGPRPAALVDFLRRELPRLTPAHLVYLRGNHEDAWLRVRDRGWPEYVLQVRNGCLSTLRSFTGGPPPGAEDSPELHEFDALFGATFFPDDVLEWMRGLRYFYEDEHAIYVHGGLVKVDGRWAHPAELADPTPLVWTRDPEFFAAYEGKRVIFGHTATSQLPQHLSAFTPEDDTDLFFRRSVIGIDTGCGMGGFLTAIELPALHVYESRR